MREMIPYRQGCLEGLCSIYSYINAVSKVIDLTESDADKLFFECFWYAVKYQDLDNAESATAEEIKKIFKDGAVLSSFAVDLSKHLQSHQKFRKKLSLLRVERPFEHKAVSAERHIKAIHDHLLRESRAVIVGLNNKNNPRKKKPKVDHWTGISSVDLPFISLFDSSIFFGKQLGWADGCLKLADGTPFSGIYQLEASDTLFFSR